MVLISLVLLPQFSIVCADEAAETALERINYNNPGLEVDLAVGLWAYPIPMDFDGDGDMDLVVSCPDTPYKGTYLFENPGGDKKFPVFKAGKRIGQGPAYIMPSYVGGKVRILVPGKEIIDMPEGASVGKALEKSIKLPVRKNVHKNRVRANQWSYADYDGDGLLDLIIGVGDWTDYGWDDAFNKKGEWTQGPLHGYVYLLRNNGTPEKASFEKPEKIQAVGRPLDVYGMPSPNLADLDGDGDLDIICGEFVDRIKYFKNIGTKTKPKYAAGKFLQHDGRDLKMDLCMIVPVAVDWDRDGDIDLVVAQEDGRVALMENTGKFVDNVPAFLPPKFFRQEAGPAKFGSLVTPFGFDWDGDGDDDLVCGNAAGYIGFIENLGKNPNA
ncbi:MAG: VCBS repeat-containing protein, partial [Pirellulales bacterium]|nr:VCBS repeat-containing protein [Pirellulales bacterium]